MATNRLLFNDPINLNLECTEQDDAFQHVPSEVQQHIAGYLDSQSVGHLSQSFSSFYALTKEQRNNAALAAFLKAVVNDDGKTAQCLLENRPDLLLMTPPQGMTVNTLAWQTFYAEAAPLMAAKRGQIEMLKIMRPYFDHLVDQEKANAMLTAVRDVWPYQYEVDDQGIPHIIIPEEYTDYAKALVNAFIAQPIQDNANLSEEAQSAFLDFFNILLPKSAVHLNDYTNPDILLLALLNVYRDRYGYFDSEEQRDTFCVRLIGLVQSVLSAEDAKIFCGGLFHMAAKELREVRAYGKQLKLYENEASFYPTGSRPHAKSTTGLGFQFFCGEYSNSGQMKTVRQILPLVNRLMRTKNNELRGILASLPKDIKPQVPAGAHQTNSATRK